MRHKEALTKFYSQNCKMTFKSSSNVKTFDEDYYILKKNLQNVKLYGVFFFHSGNFLIPDGLVRQ